jgi:large subunit ribosomal protein L16
MMQPKKRKYRKEFRGSMSGRSLRGSEVSYGDYGLKSLGRGWVTARQIESARKAISHQTKRSGKMWIRIFPDKPVTKKAAGSRMGSGKGDIEEYVVPIRPGRMLFELAGVTESTARESFRRAGNKLPIRTKFVIKD